MNNKIIKLSSVTSAVFAALLSHNAYAQDDEVNKSKLKDLETITVTSQKRTERLIDVPIAITNVDSDELVQRNIKQLSDLGDTVPNVNISQGSDFKSKVSIRGVGSNSRNIGFDSRVGVYIDGVYLGQSPGINQGLVDLERLEVLRGPQGTLFGKNSIAGAINLISQDPTDEFEGSVNVNVGNYDIRDVNLKLNVPLNDRTAAKVFLNKSELGGYITNEFLNTEIGGKEEVSGRVKIVSDMTDDLSLSFAADYSTKERLALSGMPQTGVLGGHPVTGAFGDVLGGTATDKTALYQNRDLAEDKTLYGSSLTIDYDLNNGFAFKSITSNRFSEMDIVIDSDHSSLALIETPYTDTYEQVTQEFQFISPDEGRLKYIVGAYFFGLDSSTVRAAEAGEHAFYLGLQPHSSAILIDGEIDTTSYAIFGNGSYDLSEDIVLGFGLRYSSETKSVDWTIDGSNSGVFNMATAHVLDENTYNHFSPSLNISYALSKSSQAYARMSTGFKSGGYNLDFVTQPVLDDGIAFDAETVNSFEIGYKAELMENRLRFNSAMFYSAYEDYQVNQYKDLGGGRTSISIENAADVITQGLEVEVDYQMTDDFKISSSVGLLDAYFDSFPGGGTGGSDATGNKLPNAPEVTASVSLEYYQTVPALQSNIMYRMDYGYTGQQYYTVNNDDNFVVNGDSGYTVEFDNISGFSNINARVSLLTFEGDWEVSLWVRNLADSDHIVESFREFFGGALASYAMPRTYGVEVKYNF